MYRLKYTKSQFKIICSTFLPIKYYPQNVWDKITVQARAKVQKKINK